MEVSSPLTKAKEAKMGLFEELEGIDILGPISGRLASGEYEFIPEEGRVRIKTAALVNRPWLLTKLPLDRKECDKWHHTYFKQYGFIPKACRGCWKVVGKMETLRQLMKMYDLQKKMGLFSKCGYETRKFARQGGRYCAFWYVPIGRTLEHALTVLEEVKRVVKEEFGNGVRPFLKKGCTEFELRFGDSGRWDKLAEKGDWDRKEELLETVFVSENRFMEEDRLLSEVHIKKNLIIWAFEDGDPTYRDFTDRELLPVVRKYGKEDL